MCSISSTLTQFDRVFDYSPGVSTINSLVNIVQKSALWCGIIEAKRFDRYYHHIENKHWLRCFALLVPGIGNLLVWLCDCYTFPRDRALYALKAKQDRALYALKVARDSALYALKANGLTLASLNRTLRADPGAVQIAVGENSEAIHYAHPKFKQVAQFALPLILNTQVSLNVFDRKLFKDADFILAIAEKKPWVVDYANKELWNTHYFVSEIIKIDGAFIRHAALQFRKDPHLGYIAVKNNVRAIHYLDLNLKNHPRLLLLGFKHYPSLVWIMIARFKHGERYALLKSPIWKAIKTLLNNNQYFQKKALSLAPGICAYLPHHTLTKECFIACMNDLHDKNPVLSSKLLEKMN